MRFALVAAIVASSLGAGQAFADPVPVRFTEGSLHGFLSLRGPDGQTLATGDLLQTVAAGRVTAKLVFKFRDGSISEETAVFSQRGHFKLIADHLVQKGPAFPRPLDLAIDGSTGEVTVRYTNDHGEEKVESERMELPADLANGLITTLLKNLRATPKTTLSMVAATPKPRLVKLKITSAGNDSLSIGGARRRAVHYVLKVDIGGIAGVVAPIVGKQPPDSHVWILQEEVPAFLRSQSPMFADGPLWQIDLIAPTWPSRR
jgi:hypothetical protein